MNSSAGYIADASINNEEESRYRVDTLIQQNASTHATVETVSGQIMYDAAQGGYAASLCAYTPSSIDSSDGTPRSLSVPRDLSTSELFSESCVSPMTQQSLSTNSTAALNQSELAADTGSVTESKAPIQSRISPKSKSGHNATASDTLHLTSAPYAGDGLNSEEGRENEPEDDCEGEEDHDDFDNDCEHEDSHEGRCAALVIKGPKVLGIMWDKASRAGRLNVIREVLYDTISTLRARGNQDKPNFS
jgi:hypothetical protein